MKIDISKMDVTTPWQKGVALVIGLGILSLFIYLLPSLLWFFETTLKLGLLGITIILLILLRNVIWVYLKQIAWDITVFIIKGNKPTYLYNYHKYLVEKVAQINDIRQILDTKIQMATSKLGALEADIEKNSKKANLVPDDVIAQRKFSRLVATATEFKESLLPKVTMMQQQSALLKQTFELCSADAETVKYNIDAQVEKYEMMKTMDKASTSALDILGKESSEYKLYQESLKQMESSIVEYTVKFNDFQDVIKPLIQDYSLDQKELENKGQEIIKKYLNNRK